MLAHIQRIFTVFLLGSALAWFAIFWQQDHLFAASFGACLILIAYGLFLAGEFFLLWRFRRLSDSTDPTVRDLFTAWFGEVMVAPKVFLWRQPFRSKSIHDRPSVTSTSSCGVVLVHGFVCNRGLWNGWMQKLADEKIPFVAVNLEPVFGSISNYSDIIESAVAVLESTTGQPVVVVGHSMGGLAIRTWLADYQVPVSRVSRVITIGTPHTGTWLARFATTTNGKQMRINSAWLQELMTREVEIHRRLFTCFYSPCDNIVFPAHCATLAGADNRAINRRAHMHMAFEPEPYAEVVRWALIGAR